MNNYIYIAVMAAVSYMIRVLPLTLIRKPIKNQFIQSFLYYVPYVTLAVMTFPAIIHATQTPISGLVALIAGIIAAWLGAGLFPVSVICCVLVFLISSCICFNSKGCNLLSHSLNKLHNVKHQAGRYVSHHFLLKAVQYFHPRHIDRFHSLNLENRILPQRICLHASSVQHIQYQAIHSY